MGSLTFQGVGDATFGTKTKTYTIPNSDMTRFGAWAIEKYSTRPTPVNPNPTPLTLAQALSAWADECLSDAKRAIVNRERRISQEALANPPPFVAT